MMPLAYFFIAEFLIDNRRTIGNMLSSIDNTVLYYTFLVVMVMFSISVSVLLFKKYWRNLYGVTAILAIAASLMLVSSIYGEYIPRNDAEIIHKSKNMSISLDLVSPIIIPIRDVLVGENSSAKITIYPNNSDIDISKVCGFSCKIISID
jgi:hypothetical protein